MRLPGGAWSQLLAMFVAAAACLLPGCAWARQVKVLLRYDDYSSFHDDPRVIGFERALFEGVHAAGGHLIVGVIPFPGMPYPQTATQADERPLPLGEDKRRLLQQYADAGAVTVALHGYNHGNNKRVAGVASEFSGLPERRQALLLGAGRQAVQRATGLDTRVFVPPFNQYDAATLHALSATGFELLSAGRSGPTSDVVPLRYLPETVHPQGLRRAVSAALAEGWDDTIVVATLHPYDFIDAGEPMPGFRNDGPQLRLSQWLDDLRAVASMDGVRLVSPQQLHDADEDLSSARFEANAALRQGPITEHRLLPQWARLYPADGVQYSLAVAQRILFQQIVALAVMAVVALGLSWALTRRALRRWGSARAHLRLVPLGAGLSGIGGVALHAHAAGFFFAAGLVLFVCLGMVCGSVGGRP